MFLCKWFKNIFLEFLSHSDSCIPADKFHCGHSWLSGWDFQKHIFEPFAQEHTGSRTKFAGTGLGMPIAKNLVEKMGGAITFESEEGTGTTFVIRVPFKIDMNADKREKQKDFA